jgi:hypothetical protein
MMKRKYGKELERGLEMTWKRVKGDEGAVAAIDS